MKRYFLFSFVYIIFLDIFNVNALPICVQSLINNDLRDGLSFQESVGIPDNEYKRRMLQFVNVDKSKIENTLKLGIIRDDQKQDEMLHNIIGLDDHTIKFLREKKILNVHPIEYLNFATLPPANRRYIRPGAVVSRVNTNGYLENVVITRIEGENVYVRLKRDATESVISKNEVYQPILVGKQIYYFNPIGIPIRTRIVSIRENGQIFIEYPPNNSGVKIVNGDQLKLKPRREILTGQQDISQPIKDKALNILRKYYFEIEELYKSLGNKSLSLINKNILHNNLAKTNNDLMRQLSVEMQKQGIVTRLVLEPVSVFNRKHYLLSLFIDGVHENGNKVMLSYWKKAEIFNVSGIKISLYPFIMDRKSFTDLPTSEIELDVQVALDILKRERDLVDTEHEFSHAMLTLGAHVDRPSIYHTQFRAILQKSKTGIYEQFSSDFISNPYNQDLSYQEIYAYISSLVFLSKNFVKNIKNIERTIHIIKILNEGVQNFVNNLLQNFDINHEIENLNYHYIRKSDISLQSFLKGEIGLSPFIDYWQEDNFGRIIGIKLSEDVKQALRYLITRLSSIEIEGLIEDISNSDSKIPEAYMEFLRQNPTAEEIFDYSQKNPERFLESIEKRVINIKREEASRILNQAFKRQLDQIRYISLRISEQLVRAEAIFERIKDTEFHHSENFRKAQNELLSIIRNLRLIALRAI